MLTKKLIVYDNYSLKCNDNNNRNMRFNDNAEKVFPQILHFPYHNIICLCIFIFILILGVIINIYGDILGKIIGLVIKSKYKKV